jgi:cellulase/cellobiase CelA1
VVAINTQLQKEHLMFNKKLASVGLCGAIATAAIVPAAGSAAATKSGTYKVKTTELVVYEQPAKSYEGVLVKGQSFKVKKLSESGKYAYGMAYGHVNKMGWVTASSLSRG